MVKRSVRKRSPRIRAPRKVARETVSRAEFDKVIETLNERGVIIAEMRRELDVQFRRMAQLQAELDAVKQACLRMKDRA
jgi:hypothetical protein